MLLSASWLQCLILDKQQVLHPDGWFVHGGLQLAPTCSLHQQQSLGRTPFFFVVGTDADSFNCACVLFMEHIFAQVTLLTHSVLFASLLWFSFSRQSLIHSCDPVLNNVTVLYFEWFWCLVLAASTYVQTSETQSLKANNNNNITACNRSCDVERQLPYNEWNGSTI